MKHSGIIILLILIFSLSTSSLNKGTSKKVLDQKCTPIVVILDSIKNEIIELGLLYPDVVYAQVLHESNSLNSSLYVNNHNLFGMRASSNRATTSTKILNGYKWYPNWRESLLDYALLQMAYYRVNSKEAYYRLLQRSYAEDSSYIIKLKKYE